MHAHYNQMCHRAEGNARLAMAATKADCDGSTLRKRNRRPVGLAFDRYSKRTLRSHATVGWVLMPGSRNFSQACIGACALAMTPSNSLPDTPTLLATMLVSSPGW